VTPPHGSDRAPKVTLERMPYDPVSWEAIVAGHPEAEVFHGAPWLEFLADSQGAEPVVAVVRADGLPVGYFVGGIVRRFGVRILGSPLRGWGTMVMGFLLEEGVDRRAAAEALIPFAFRDLRCLHVELSDRRLTVDQMAGTSYVVEIGRTYVVDLEPEEEAIFGRMRSTSRNYVRQASRKGVRAERATSDDFADEYYGQLVEVFARQGLGPTYGVDRVRKLIKALQPADEILLMRVRAPNGADLATAVVVGRNRTAVLWGAAFHRSLADSHPNELLHWEAMRHWRARGVLRYDMGGGGDYKAKYGGVETPSIHFYRSRYALLRHGRTAVRLFARARQLVAGARRRPSATHRNLAVET
jgi:CelD/BcsL family acetyltransferase involved in cellulose biosynthesis